MDIKEILSFICVSYKDKLVMILCFFSNLFIYAYKK